MQTLHAVVIMGNSLMELAFVILQKTDSMTSVDFVVVLKIDFGKVCFVRVRSDSVEVHFVKLTGSATVAYVVAKADFAIKGLGTEVDSEKLVFSNARRFDQVDLYSERCCLCLPSLARFSYFFSLSCLLLNCVFAVSDAGWVCLFGCFLFCCFFSFLGALALLRVVAVLVAVLFVQ